MSIVIDKFTPSASPLDAIAKGLSIAKDIYGIKQAGLAQDLLAKQSIAEQQKIDATKAAQDLAAKSSDPESATSKLAQANYINESNAQSKILGSTVDPSLAKLVLGSREAVQADEGPSYKDVPGLSATELSKFNDNNLTKLATGKLAAQAAGAKAATFGARNGIQVSKDYESTMKPYRGLTEDISRVESALATKDKDGNPLITSQQLGDANAAIARIFSPGHMSDATVNRTEYESLPAKFSAAIQKISTDPTDIGSRNLVNHIIDQAHHIGNVSNQNAMRELDSLDSGYQSLGDPVVTPLAAAKSADFRKRFSKQFSTIGSEGSGGDSNGGLISSANADSAQTKIINGTVYTKVHGGWKKK